MAEKQDEVAEQVLKRLLVAADHLSKQNGPKVIYANAFEMAIGEIDFTVTPVRSGNPPDTEILLQIQTAKKFLQYQFAALRAHELVCGPTGNPLPTMWDEELKDLIEAFKGDLQTSISGR